MVSMQDNVITSESRLTFMEASSIIVGHGVGSGILAVPFLASRNRWQDFLWIVLAAYLINLVLHFMIAELSYNNNGAQFIKCFEKGIYSLPNEESIMDSLYDDEDTTSDNLPFLACTFPSSRAVILAVANLYLRQQIIFE